MRKRAAVADGSLVGKAASDTDTESDAITLIGDDWDPETGVEYIDVEETQRWIQITAVKVENCLKEEQTEEEEEEESEVPIHELDPLVRKYKKDEDKDPEGDTRNCQVRKVLIVSK